MSTPRGAFRHQVTNRGPQRLGAPGGPCRRSVSSRTNNFAGRTAPARTARVAAGRRQFAVGALQQIGDAGKVRAFVHGARRRGSWRWADQFADAQRRRQLRVLQHHADVAARSDGLRISANSSTVPASARSRPSSRPIAVVCRAVGRAARAVRRRAARGPRVERLDLPVGLAGLVQARQGGVGGAHRDAPYWMVEHRPPWGHWWQSRVTRQEVTDVR